MLNRLFLVSLTFINLMFVYHTHAETCATGSYNSNENGCLKPLAEEPVNAFEKPMTFTMRQITIRPEGTWIAAEGIITKDTPNDFRKFLKSNIVYKENRIEFNSPGGNFYAAMELGRLIREKGNSTTIGRTLTLDGPEYTEILRFENPVCFSACAYAFLGGQERYFSEGDKLGVHQFGNKYFDVSGNQAQSTTSDIARYIEEMGADQRLLQIASRVEFDDEIFVIDNKIAEELKVIFDPNNRKSKFEISLVNGHIVANTIIYHKGFQYSARLHCIDKIPRLVVWGQKDTIPVNFHEIHAGTAKFTSKKTELYTKVDGGVLSNGNAYTTFTSLDLAKMLAENGQLKLEMTWPSNWEKMELYDRIQWVDMAVWFGFSIKLENAANTVPIVIRECK